MYIHVPADFLRRRSMQSALIDGGMIQYSVALLMNLCLRSKGNLHCIMYSIQ